jgi:uncharacterized protein YbjT (DUF2867 family)
MGKILITGASGNIGGAALEHCLRSDSPVVTGSRSVRNRRSISSLHEEVPFDLTDADTFNEALKGVDRVLLIRPPQLADPKRDMLPFLNAAATANPSLHVVFVSLLGVENNPIAPHGKIEKYIREKELPFTMLRPSFFMQNLTTAHRDDIRLRNEIALPVGKAKTSFIDTRDIGEAAANCLLHPEKHANKVYTLTGDKALTYEEAASILSEVLERPISYRSPSFLRFRKEQISYGSSRAFANVMTMLYFLTRMGSARTVTSDIGRLLGRPPRSFYTFAQDHKQYWID